MSNNCPYHNAETTDEATPKEVLDAEPRYVHMAPTYKLDRKGQKMRFFIKDSDGNPITNDLMTLDTSEWGDEFFTQVIQAERFRPGIILEIWYANAKHDPELLEGPRELSTEQIEDGLSKYEWSPKFLGAILEQVDSITYKKYLAIRREVYSTSLLTFLAYLRSLEDEEIYSLSSSSSPGITSEIIIDKFMDYFIKIDEAMDYFKKHLLKRLEDNLRDIAKEIFEGPPHIRLGFEKIVIREIKIGISLWLKNHLNGVKTVGQLVAHLKDNQQKQPQVSLFDDVLGTPATPFNFDKIFNTCPARPHVVT